MAIGNSNNKYKKYHVIEVGIVLENIEDRSQNLVHALYISYTRIQLGKYHQYSPQWFLQDQKKDIGFEYKMILHSYFLI